MNDDQSICLQHQVSVYRYAPRGTRDADDVSERQVFIASYIYKFESELTDIAVINCHNVTTTFFFFFKLADVEH